MIVRRVEIWLAKPKIFLFGLYSVQKGNTPEYVWKAPEIIVSIRGIPVMISIIYRVLNLPGGIIDRREMAKSGWFAVEPGWFNVLEAVVKGDRKAGEVYERLKKILKRTPWLQKFWTL